MLWFLFDTRVCLQLPHICMHTRVLLISFFASTSSVCIHFHLDVPSIHTYFRFATSLFGLSRDKILSSFFVNSSYTVDDITEMRLTVRACTSGVLSRENVRYSWTVKCFRAFFFLSAHLNWRHWTFSQFCTCRNIGLFNGEYLIIFYIFFLHFVEYHFLCLLKLS